MGCITLFWVGSFDEHLQAKNQFFPVYVHLHHLGVDSNFDINSQKDWREKLRFFIYED